ncbi:UNVERIFIED_CONTAM: hypothetical protein K2H54_051765 [Gekko kuhli]
MPYSLGYSEFDIQLKPMQMPFRRRSYAPEPGIQRFQYPIEVADDAVQTEEQDDRGNNGTPKGGACIVSVRERCSRLGYSEFDIQLKLMQMPFRRRSYAPEVIMAHQQEVKEKVQTASSTAYYYAL